MASETDRNPTSGPRGCKDFLFLLLFIAAVSVMIAFGSMGIYKGDPYRLIYGMDSYGNTCGRKNSAVPGSAYSGRDMTSMKYSMFLNPRKILKRSQTTVLCVKKCNDKNITSLDDVKELFTRTASNLCKYDVNPGKQPLVDKNCVSVPYPETTQILHRCIPKKSHKSKAIASITKNNDFVQRFMTDIRNSYKTILVVIACSAVGGFVFCLGFNFIAAPLIWAVYLLAIVSSGGGIAYVWYKHQMNLSAQPPLADKYKKQWLASSVLITVICLLFLLILIFMRKQIPLLAALFGESGRALRSMPILLILPAITMVLWLAVSAGMIFMFFYVLTAGDCKVVAEGKVVLMKDKLIRNTKWYHLFCFFWISQFIVACQEMIVAGAVSFWFFTRDRSSCMNFPVTKSIWNLMRCHLGTVAYGSLIIAVVQLARSILMSIQTKLASSENEVAKCILKSLACCMWFLEKFLRFVNRNAYIQCAIHNHSYCQGARAALTVLLEHGGGVIAINAIGSFVLLIAKLIMTIATIISFHVSYKHWESLNYVASPLVCVGLGAYLVASIYFGAYEITIDALFICFCEDLKINDGMSSPYFMNKGLMRLVDRFKKQNKGKKDKGANQSGTSGDHVFTYRPPTTRHSDSLNPTTSISTHGYSIFMDDDNVKTFAKNDPHVGSNNAVRTD